MNIIRNCSQYSYISTCLCLFYLDEEVDGKTLFRLSEGMVERVLPTMKLQVKFIELQKGLSIGRQSGTPEVPPESPELTPEVVHPCPSEQNG